MIDLMEKYDVNEVLSRLEKMYNLRQMLKKVDKDAITNIENIKK